MPVKKAKSKAEPSKEKYAHIPKDMQRYAVPIKEIKPDKNNPRKHDIAKLKEAIENMGFRVPVIVDSTGTIRAGNGRYKAAIELGMQYIPAIKQEFLSKEAATAFSILDNKAHEWSSWDDDVLSKILNTKGMQDSIGLTGFSSAEISKVRLEPLEDLIAGADVGHIITSALKSSLGVLHFGLVRSGKLCITDLEVFVEIDTDLPDGTVIDLGRYATTHDIAASISNTEGVCDGFPEVPQVGKKIGAAGVPECARWYSKYSSTEPTRMELHHVFIHGGLIFATDGSYGVSSAFESKVNLAISPSMVKCVAGKDVSIFDKHTQMHDGCVTITGRTPDATAPAYEKVLPKKSGQFIVNAVEMSAAVGTVLPLASPANKAIVLHGKMVSTGKTADGAYGSEMSTTDVDGTVVLNGEFLSQILRDCIRIGSGATAQMWMSDSKIGPTCFDAGGHTFLIMPLRGDDLVPDANDIRIVNAESSSRASRSVLIKISTPIGSVRVRAVLGAGVTPEMIRASLVSGTTTAEVA